uniref:Uncharacterized protein n=1 Tax=Corethron hystrix TaxID=216773 RepID=A0A7S1G1M9_9STRA|mmetsp:Transcript_6510/g.14067  ORF Transcript_6510/g.14067 Transcript_6510/m.14067 type:complete len:250 (+) Transcript_6510:69-818(+)
MTKTLYDEGGVSLTANEETCVHTLRLNRGPNVVNHEMIRLLSAALAAFEGAPHPKALLVTGSGKFFSAGLDLKFMMSSTHAQRGAMIVDFWALLARLLVADCRTVAAVDGHAFGAGLFLALACDFRIMRTGGSSRLCWPEANLGMRLAKGFAELTRAKVSDPAVLREGVLTSRKYGSGEAREAGLIDAEVTAARWEEEGAALAEAGLPEKLGLQNFDPKAYRQMKIELYADAYRALTSGDFDAAPDSRL